MLSVQEVNEVGALQPFRESWSALANAAPTGDFFQTPEWICAWLQTFWKGKPIAFLFVKRGEELVGLLPLLDDERGDNHCARSLSSLVNSHARRSELLCNEDPTEVLDATLMYLRQSRKSVRVHVRHDASNDVASEAIRAVARANRLGVAVKPIRSAPIIRVTGTWDAYLASRPKRVRSELGRKTRKIERAWALEFRTVTEPDACERRMTDVLRIERNSWKAHAGTSFLAEPGIAAFYSGLARTTARSGWLRLHLLYLNGEPAAHIFGIEHRGVFWALKTSYDEAYQAWSPGAVIFQYALKEWFEAGVTTIDLLGSESRWKDELGNEERSYVDACLFSRDQLRCHFCKLRDQQIKPLFERGVAVLGTTGNRLKVLAAGRATATDTRSHRG